MTPPSDFKRRKLSHSDTSRIAEKLNELSKPDLEKVARAGITESEAALNLARDLLDERNGRILHCVRCHKDYDPLHGGNKDCVMEEHDEDGLGNWEGGMASSSALTWSCCGKSEDYNGPCFEGPHMSVYGDGGYWRDDELEEVNESGFCSTCQGEEQGNSGGNIQQRVQNDEGSEIIAIVD